MSAVIFDFNGTMVFDSPYHDLAWKAFSKQLRGYEMSDEEIGRNVHGKVNEKIIEYLKPDASDEEKQQLSLDKEAAYRSLCLKDKENYQLVNGLPDFLDYLKEKGIKRTIASASIKVNIDFFVSTFNLSNWFEPDKIAYDDGSFENKIPMFKAAADNIGVSIEDCIIFEDSFSGIACAKAVNAKKIVVIAPKNRWHEFVNDEQIAMVIEDFSDERIKSLF